MRIIQRLHEPLVWATLLFIVFGAAWWGFHPTTGLRHAEARMDRLESAIEWQKGTSAKLDKAYRDLDAEWHKASRSMNVMYDVSSQTLCILDRVVDRVIALEIRVPPPAPIITTTSWQLKEQPILILEIPEEELPK